MKTKKLTTLAMLTATALVIFVVESQIPLPVAIPGLKLGLSNVITLFALWTLGRKEALIVLTVRVILGNLVAGSGMSMLYSLCGGLLCLLVMSLMLGLFRARQVWILSMFGALAHNIGQLLAAAFVMQTWAVFTYAPVLVLAALITGFFTGQAAQAVIAHMDKIKFKLD